MPTEPLLRAEEAIDLHAVFACAGRYGPADRLVVIRALWEKVRSAFRCELDTDGDGDCHKCAWAGGCSLRKPV